MATVGHDFYTRTDLAYAPTSTLDYEDTLSHLYTYEERRICMAKRRLCTYNI